MTRTKRGHKDNHNDKDDECQSCIRLLQRVLSAPNTKSSQLLRHVIFDDDDDDHSKKRTSTAGSNSREEYLRMIPNGVQVRIPQHPPPPPPPATATAALKPPTKQQQQQQQQPTVVTNDFSVLATTSTATTTTTTTTNNNNNTIDWIDMTCRSCSDFGPEANARAFVMGPSPLSIVVCHNRIASPNDNNNNNIANANINRRNQNDHHPNQDTGNHIHHDNHAFLHNHESSPSPSARPATYIAPIWNPWSTRLSTANTTMNTMDDNNNNNMKEMDEIITHELIHIYDVRQLQLNLVHCHDLAYSEIRAAREAECSHLNHHGTTTGSNSSSFRSHTESGSRSIASSIRNSDRHDNRNQETGNPQQQKQQHKQFNDCVRTRATTATKNIFPSYRAHQCIQQVYTAAMADLRPFRMANNNHNNNETDSTPLNDPYVSKK